MPKKPISRNSGRKPKGRTERTFSHIQIRQRASSLVSEIAVISDRLIHLERKVGEHKAKITRIFMEKRIPSRSEFEEYLDYSLEYYETAKRQSERANELINLTRQLNQSFPGFNPDAAIAENNFAIRKLGNIVAIFKEIQTDFRAGYGLDFLKRYLEQHLPVLTAAIQMNPEMPVH